MGELFRISERRSARRDRAASCGAWVVRLEEHGTRRVVKLVLPTGTLLLGEQVAYFAGTLILAAFDSGLTVGQVKDLARVLKGVAGR